jgi:hypothetical protein
MTLSSNEIANAVKSGEILISLEMGLHHPVHVYARVDSGASMSSIHYELLLMLVEQDEKHYYMDRDITVKSALGKEKRSTAMISFGWDENEFELEVNSADRKKLGCPVLLGRDWLGTE